MSAWTETIRHIGEPGEDNVFLEVGPDGDGLGHVRVRTTNAKSDEWWGKIDFNVAPAIAIALGHALIRAASEAEAQ